MRRLLWLMVASLIALATASACSSSEVVTIDATGATVIDVRTPAEYADGHLDGAVNIDVQDPEGFATAAAQLDPAGSYIVYCRTGNRSAAATAQLRDLGFDDVTDAGGLDEAAAATGLPVVT